jgi:hypothetical protein
MDIRLEFLRMGISRVKRAAVVKRRRRSSRMGWISRDISPSHHYPQCKAVGFSTLRGIQPGNDLRSGKIAISQGRTKEAGEKTPVISV